MHGSTSKQLVWGLALSVATINAHAHGGDSSLVHACVDSQNILKLSGPDQECPAGETPLHWAIEGPPGPTDPELLGRISTLEAQVATLQSQVAELTDPALPDIVISDVTFAEGTSTDNSNSFTFTVSLSMPTNDTVTINYYTEDGTAGTSDYTSRSGQLVFYPGETSKTLGIGVSRDTTIELDETFFLKISNVVNANVLDGNGNAVFGTATIVNDDFPAVSISGQQLGQEGELFSYDVSLSAPSPAVVTVDYSAIDGTATLADNDFAATQGTLAFNPGQTTATIQVQTNADQAAEGQETFAVGLSNPTNAVLSVVQATSTVFDNSVSLSIQDASVIEGNSGSSPFTVMQMHIVLGQPVTGEVTVRYGQSTGGTATNYTLYNTSGDVRVLQYSNCHADTSPSTCPTLVFSPGETQKTIYIQVNGDRTREANDNFFVKIFEPTGAVIGDDVAEGVIINDD